MKNNKQEPRQIADLDPELQAIAAEYPEFASIVAGADYTATGPQVYDPDPEMRYYWAAKNDPSRPDGVERVKQLGYRVSDKEHTSPDCELMETPRKLWDYRQQKVMEANKKKMQGVRREVEKPTREGLEVMDHVRSPRGAKPGFQKLTGE